MNGSRGTGQPGAYTGHCVYVRARPGRRRSPPGAQGKARPGRANGVSLVWRAEGDPIVGRRQRLPEQPRSAGRGEVRGRERVGPPKGRRSVGRLENPTLLRESGLPGAGVRDPGAPVLMGWIGVPYADPGSRPQVSTRRDRALERGSPSLWPPVVESESLRQNSRSHGVLRICCGRRCPQKALRGHRRDRERADLVLARLPGA
ncbi:MAG: hypothetical protein QOK40_1191 [Miltoncostaeaceae bacterium]|nr:hypothetical protein [Miltoncostaeaceae bacterium]